MSTTTRNITATKFQRKNLLYNIVTGKAVITSTIAGGITLNPIVFASLTLLTGFGLVVKAVASFQKYDKKTEKANFARVEHKKILHAIRFYLRGEPFNEKAFFDKLKMVEHLQSKQMFHVTFIFCAWLRFQWPSWLKSLASLNAMPTNPLLLHLIAKPVQRFLHPKPSHHCNPSRCSMTRSSFALFIYKFKWKNAWQVNTTAPKVTGKGLEPSKS